MVIQTDASDYGLEAALLQDGRPIAFASKTLTDVETQYANIECKCLYVCFGLEKFHTYTYGRYILVHNDNKSLKMIEKKPIHTAAPHLQRMLLCLQKYGYTIQYKPGKEMVLVDCLSQFPSRKENMPIQLHQNMYNIYFTPDKLNIVRGVVERDPIHRTIYRLTLNGWPKRIQEVPPHSTPLLGHQCWVDHRKWSIVKGRQSVHTPWAVWGDAQWSPQQPQRNRKDKTPFPNHCLLVQNRCGFANYVNWCKICTNHKAKQAVQPMLPRDVPGCPWQDLAADFFTYNHKEYLLIADTFNKYPFVYQTSSKSADSIIKKLQNLISQYGPPKKIFSDDGSPFLSEALQMFLASQYIDHITSSPHYPKSNGFLETQIKTIKIA